MEQSPSLQGPHETAIWFTQSQLQSVIRNGIVPQWFHGIISRKTAEELLMSKPPGYFLIRVSESRIGYTLSYRAEDRCRHFMIDVQQDGRYIIVGETMHHQSLQDMVDFHRRSPIMPYNEVLTVACGQSSSIKSDYAELLFPQRHPNPNTSPLPNNSLNADTNLQLSQEAVPPALPNRPNNMKLPAAGSQGRLYPRLEEQFPDVMSSLQPTPVLTNRNHPPELPDRSSLPPLKQNQACTRTVSAPQTPTEHPSSPQRNQEAKPSVVSNIKNLKKKFQKKRSPSQELMHAESSTEVTENVYQEITEEQGFSSLPPSYTCPEVRLTNGGLPYEYKHPPPFAPGY